VTAGCSGTYDFASGFTGTSGGTTRSTLVYWNLLSGGGSHMQDRIVAAAAELMFEGGVAGTTMEMVRAAARVSSSQIYHYFADKETLVRAVIEYQNETVVGGQAPMLAKLDSLDGIRAWRDSLVEHQRQLGCRGGCPIGALGSELAEIDPQARAAVAGGLGRWEAGIRDGFQAMHTRGELAPGASPDRLATTMLAALQGGLLLSQLQRSTGPLEVALDTLIDHIAALDIAPAMAERGQGAIVNVVTMAAQFGVPGMAVDGASKAALT
jgi:AcrR family transcriptional regulator